MNFKLPFLPERKDKPRESGLTIMTDRGLSVREAESFAEGNAPYCDFVKMAFGTSLLIPSLESKLNIYREAGTNCYFGGTLFEVFVRQNAMEDYEQYLDRYGIEFLEISDSVVTMDRKEKLAYIKRFSEEFEVLSQVTNFVPQGHLSFDRIVTYANEELEAGAQFIIVKESEQMPLFSKDGLAAYLTSKEAKNALDLSKLIWDAPNKQQQIELINLFGANVNLCNVRHDDVIALEAKRLGLHSSTLLKLIPEGNRDKNND